MTRVLVTAASKYGSTLEIAEAIGARLATDGRVDVTVTPAEDAPDPTGYDAVVVGSAVYAGRWLKPAREWVDANREALQARRVWLFSSGPLGDPPQAGGGSR